jgi:serine/threonine protein kinase
MSDDDDLPRLLDGRYRLDATLGHGGMGVVFRGTDLMMQRSIAVKLVRGVDGVDLDDEVAGRFLREAKNTARMQHEHIIEVFDLGRTEEGGLYFVMELLDGESLSERLRREGAISPERTVHIGRQICQALEVAHAAGIIHRDLKPANVMLLTRAGDTDYVKVLDFGVAKSFAGGDDTQLTRTGMLVGTVDYMAPEQIAGKPVDGRTDVYALGVVLYKMLSGRAPFRDTGVPALIHAHLNTMPTPLIEVTKAVPNELDRVVLRCLAKNPERRYESMAELGRALTAAIQPDDSNLIDLEYGRGDNDVYFSDEQTMLARTPSDPIPVPDDATLHDARHDRHDAPRASPRLREEEPDPALDDATLTFDRPLPLRKATTAGGSSAGRPPMKPRNGVAVPRPPSPPSPPTPQRGPSQREEPRAPRFGAPANPPRREPELPQQRISHYPDDVATERRPEAFEVSPSDEVGRADRSDRIAVKTCAMCQSPNSPHARACQACGVSLARADQEAVRVRVRSTAPPSPQYTGAPAFSMQPMDTYGMPNAPRGPSSYPHPRGPYGTPSPMHGVPISPPWLPHQPPPAPPSMWQRFLTWTGLRGR